MELKILRVRESSGDSIRSPDALVSLMTEEAKADRECFWVFHLNTGNQVIEKDLVSIGTLSSSLVHPREVFKKAILNSAARIITVHNHPGGQSFPSKDDGITWGRLDEAGKLLGITVLDHLIITPSGKFFSSYQEIYSKEKGGKHNEEERKTY